MVVVLSPKNSVKLDKPIKQIELIDSIFYQKSENTLSEKTFTQEHESSKSDYEPIQSFTVMCQQYKENNSLKMLNSKISEERDDYSSQ